MAAKVRWIAGTERRLRLLLRCDDEETRIRRWRELLEKLGASAEKWTEI